MTHPLQSYYYETKDEHVPDEEAREYITGLVNDNDFIGGVCGLFHEENNADATCFAMGKVYDVNGQSRACVSIISQDVAGIIGEPIQEVQENINLTLFSTYLEFRCVCNGSSEIFDAWDGYLDLILSKTFLPFYENGMRARLIYNGRIGEIRMPTVVFIVYLQYSAI